MKTNSLILALLLSLSHLSLAQSDFDKFVDVAANENQIELTLAKQFLKVPAVEEAEDLSSMVLDVYQKRDNFHLFTFLIEDKKECLFGYTITLDNNGLLLDQIENTNQCEIDLEAQSQISSTGLLDGNIIEVMHEEETVVDPSDTTATLNNSETTLLSYSSFYEIASDGYFIFLSSPKDVNQERDYPFASEQLLKPDDIKDYSKNELRLIRSEILASYGHIFDDKDLQERYENTTWYTLEGDANDKLTDIEKRNIALIDSFLLN